MNIILPIHTNSLYRFLLKHGTKLLILALCIISTTSLTNCSSASAPSYAPLSGSLNRNSVSDANRTIVKTGSLNLNASNIRQTSETIEQIVSDTGGHITSMNERDDKTKYANFQIRVPAHQLISTMDQIASLGKVTYRKVSVEDVTAESIRQTAKLNHLKARRERLKALYKSAGTLSDKLKIEQSLSQIEKQIFNMEEAIKQLNKTASFSKLSVSITQKTIRGPLGLIKDSTTWSLKKLFTIRE